MQTTKAKVKDRTFLICAAPQEESFCKSCKRPIVWVLTAKYARHPMDKGFAVIESQTITIAVNDRLNRLQEVQRVNNADSHFATCPHAAFHKAKKK